MRNYLDTTGVSAFAVIMGYLAAKSGTNESKSLLRYTINRYIYFLVAEIIANAMIMTFFKFAPEYMWIAQLGLEKLSAKETVLFILKNAVHLDSKIYTTFWFIKPFFYASFICFILSRYRIQLIPLVLLDLALYCMGQGWVAICMLGAILYRIVNYDSVINSLLSKKRNRIIIVIVGIVLIKLFPRESEITYYMDGISNLLFYLVIFNSQKIQDAFEWRKLSSITNKYMAFLILHRQVFHMLASLLNRRYEGILNTHAGFFGVMLLCYVVTILLCFPMDWLLNTLHKFICKVLTYIPFEKIEGKIQA